MICHWLLSGPPLALPARRASRIRRAFGRQSREHAIPISGVTTPGWPPLWTCVQPRGSGRPTYFLPKASTRNVSRTPHASQIATSSYVMIRPRRGSFNTSPDRRARGVGSDRTLCLRTRTSIGRPTLLNGADCSRAVSESSNAIARPRKRFEENQPREGFGLRVQSPAGEGAGAS